MPPASDSTAFRLSASKLKRYLQCPRAYFLRYVQGVEEDVGGNYLVIGTAYDLHVQWYLSRGARGVQSIEPRIVRMFDAARRHLPEPGAVEVQCEYRVVHPDGFVVEGKPDLRRPGWLGDTKTTSASGPGVGSAMTPAQLAADVQFRMYAWCEYQLGFTGVAVPGVWSYVNKDTKPKAWNIMAAATPTMLNDWFDSVVRPAAAAMAALEAEADAERVTANLDACDRCWVRKHCNPYSGPNSYDGLDSGPSLVQLRGTRPVSPARQEQVNGDVDVDLPMGGGVGVSNGVSFREGAVNSMAFDLKKLSEDVDLTEVLAASVAANEGAPIAINPPRPVIDHTVELEAVIELCQSAAARAGELLARIRGAS